MILIVVHHALYIITFGYLPTEGLTLMGCFQNFKLPAIWPEEPKYFQNILGELFGDFRIISIFIFLYLSSYRDWGVSRGWPERCRSFPNISKLQMAGKCGASFGSFSSSVACIRAKHGLQLVLLMCRNWILFEIPGHFSTNYAKQLHVGLTCIYFLFSNSKVDNLYKN